MQKYIIIDNLDAECFNDPKEQILQDANGDTVDFDSIDQAINWGIESRVPKFTVYKKVSEQVSFLMITNKGRIISEFNSKYKKLEEEYLETDLNKYLKTITPDPYGFKIDMPKEKFPEYYKWQEEMNILNNEYHIAISKLAKYKKGDIVVVGHENFIKFGKIKDEDFFINGGNDILYQICFDEIFNVWKYGSSGGSFGKNSCTCAFEEKYILRIPSFEESESILKNQTKN